MAENETAEPQAESHPAPPDTVPYIDDFEPG
jgi:hypothetical protein